VLALVLGPVMEKSFRQALISAQGNPLTFIERPLSATFIAIALVFFLLPAIKRLRSGARRVSPAE
jgi:putative tricarboxylic transport membrane protein